MTTYTVTAPLVIVRNEDGSDRYVYQGAVLPSGGLAAGEAKRLMDDGLISSDAAPAPMGEVVEKPVGNGSLQAWQEYAVSRGASQDDLDGKSRDDLRDEYSK